MEESIKIQEKQMLYRLCQIPEFGNATIRTLWERHRSFIGIYNIEETGLKPSQKKALEQWKTRAAECDERYERMSQMGIRFVTIFDEEYPERLREIHDYPMAFYVRGSLPDPAVPAVAIVGARSCSNYGKQMAGVFGRVLSEAGIQVISGMAIGIDSAAHYGAVHAEKPTYAVLGCGINICYPSRNYQLYEALMACGGIISEYTLDEQAQPFHFPLRNRIISALSDVILVVEAKERSGSLITAEFGLEQGKEIFAVPGRVTDPLSKGCNQLIQQGAGIAISPDEILEYFSIKQQKKLILYEKNINRLAKKEKIVYSCLDFNPKHVDTIANTCKLSVPECLELLLGLELGGYVIQTANHYYEKKMEK